MTEIKRGQIYMADLSLVVGSEQGGVRPCVVIQNDIGSRYSPTVIVAAITGRTKKEFADTYTVEIYRAFEGFHLPFGTDSYR